MNIPIGLYERVKVDRVIKALEGDWIRYEEGAKLYFYTELLKRIGPEIKVLMTKYSKIEEKEGKDGMQAS